MIRFAAISAGAAVTLVAFGSGSRAQ